MEKENIARQRGDDIPDAPRFDSNCITLYRIYGSIIQSYRLFYKKIDHWKTIKVIFSCSSKPEKENIKLLSLLDLKNIILILDIVYMVWMPIYVGFGHS